MNRNTLKAIKAKVTGVVQGVGFRYATVSAAQKLNLTGFVRNCMDMSVEVMAEGDPENLKRLIAWLKKGPPFARVERVDVASLPYRGTYRRFSILN